MTREKELWAMALWVENHHGANGPRFIAEKVAALALAGEESGVDLWRAVADRYDKLRVAEGQA